MLWQGDPDHPGNALQLRSSAGINQGFLGSNPSGITTNINHMTFLTDLRPEEQKILGRAALLFPGKFKIVE